VYVTDALVTFESVPHPAPEQPPLVVLWFTLHETPLFKVSFTTVAVKLID